MVRPEGVEPPTYWFVASCSIQLSYGRTLQSSNPFRIPDDGQRGKPTSLLGEGRRGGGFGRWLVRKQR